MHVLEIQLDKKNNLNCQQDSQNLDWVIAKFQACVSLLAETSPDVQCSCFFVDDVINIQTLH